MANPLHDNPKSKKPEEDQDAKQSVEKKAAAAKKNASDEGEPSAAKGSSPGATERKDDPIVADADAATQEEAPKKDMFMDGLKSIQKRHDTERRDYHGNHREALRQMAGRHNKEIADHFDLHFGEGDSVGTEAGKAAEAPAAKE